MSNIFGHHFDVDIGGLEHGILRVDLGHSAVEDCDLVELQKMVKVQQLFLTNTAITDTGLAALRSMTGLKELHLRGTRITDAGLVHLEHLLRLQWLDVAHTRVTECGLRRVATLRSLKMLSTDDRQLANEAHAELTRLCPSLAILRVRAGDGG